MRNVDDWVAQTKLAESGKLDQSDAEKLARRLQGAFYRRDGYWQIANCAESHNWSGMLGGLMLYQDEQQHEIAKAAAAANTISANASSYARASAIAETSFYEALNELDSLNLEDADRDSIAELIREVHKVDNDESLAKHALKSLIDRAFELGLDAVKVVLPYVWGVLSSFVNGL